MDKRTLQGKARLTEREKRANDYQWYKDQIDRLDTMSLGNSNLNGFGEVSEYKRMKTNYDLFNNIINVKDFAYVCQPFGADAGDLPATFTNRDIVSGKIKVLLGMQMKMPFEWRVVAVNEEATTRKEEEEFGRIRDFVIDNIMKPIRMQQEQQMMESAKGRQLTPQEQQDLQAQMEQEIESKTPDKVRQYMRREHQDPAEALMRQLLEYLIPEKRLIHKFGKGFKHTCLSGKEIYWVGILNGEPDMEPVNPLYFDHDLSPDLDFIEDGEWAVREIRMTPSEVISKLGSELTEEQIDRIYDNSNNPATIANSDFTFTEDGNDPYTIRVLHATWKAPTPVNFLTYLDENGKEQMMLVDENYKLNKAQGDIKLEREWPPMSYEGYKIMSDIYVHCRPVPGQDKDIDNLWECKLPYYGAVTDSLNAPVTAPMDRMKAYQFFYNVILYRIEMLMASDKGKVLVGNINAIPKSAGIDINKFMYFLEANKIAWVNPNEEGNRAGNTDSKSMFSVADLSLVSDIYKYMQIADSIAVKCGASIGVTPQMEAQIAPGDAVTNTQQNLIQASYIVQPYFELHNTVKGNVLQALIDTAVVAYSDKPPAKLSYVLDDMSLEILKLQPKLLAASKYGLFMSNATKAADAKRAVESLSQAAMQNQQADLADVIKVIKSNSINEAEELLEVAADRKQAQIMAGEKQKLEAQKQQMAAAEQVEREKHERDKELIILKEEERRKTVLQQQTIASMGFDPNKDEDGDGEPDIMELYKHGLDTEIKRKKAEQDDKKIDLNERQFQYQKEFDRKKLAQEEEKMKIMKTKKTQS